MADSKTQNASQGFKISSFNCNGINKFKKRKDVFDYLRNQKSNIILLQETHLPFKDENFISANWGCTLWLAGSETNKNGVAILFKNNFEHKVHNVFRDPEGRFLLLDLEVLKKRLTLANIYGPSSGDSPDFFKTLATKLEQFGNENMILGGDWNVVLDRNLDSRNYASTTNRPRSRTAILNMMSKLDLIDIFRTLYPSSRKYTWRKFNSIKQGRLDFFLISNNLLSEINGSNIGSSYRSDHSFIDVVLRTDERKRDKQFWKFNNSLLKDTGFVKEVQKVILDLKQEYALPVYNLKNILEVPNDMIQFTISDQLFFEMLLLKIREKTISYSCFKKKVETEREKELEARIKQLNESINNDNLEELEQSRIQLQELRDRKVEGMIVRSRTKWIQDGEKPSQYFCSLESRNFTDRSMNYLENNKGEIISDQYAVLKEVESFFRQLYSQRIVKNVDLGHILKETNKLSDEESILLEGPLTYGEIREALKNMKNNKSPGSDGFTVEFYKFFFMDIGSFLVRSLNDGFEKQCMSSTQRQGIIICLPKEEKPKQYLKNWRPISLLNTAYKIASASIANRIKGVLPKIIHEDQKGFMAGRYIGENIRKIYDVLQYSEQERVPGLLLSIDFEKAFDSIAWSFLKKALNFFNFGPGMIRWISTFYENITTCVSVNGQYSDWFHINRGVRQGDPCSPYLYLIGAEVLSILIRQHKNIKGIKVREQEVLLSQFADDTNICLDGTEKSFKEVINVLKSFAQISGLKINHEKTNVIWFGSMKNSAIKYMRDENFCWNPGVFRILGIQFCLDLKRMTEINFQGKLDSIKRLLGRWSRRDLSPLGKITVIKTLVVSKLTYLLLNLPDPPVDFTKELQAALFSFLWSDKPAKIKRTVVCRTYTEGGLQMIDVHAYIASLKLSWLKRLTIEGSFQRFSYALFPNFVNMSKLGEEYVHVCLRSCNNLFWKDVLKHFKCLYTKCIPTTPAEFMAECIHYNKYIIRGRHVVFVKEWVDQHLLYIHQLYNTSSNRFYTFQEFKDIQPNISKTNFLLYSGIVGAIVEHQRKCNIQLNDNSRIMETKIWKTVKEGSKSIQGIFLKSNVLPAAVPKWNLCFENLNWFRIFKHCKTFRDTKLKWFQLRILHRLLPTRKYLYDRKIVDDPTCYICQEETHTIQHLLWKCKSAQAFWQDLLFAMSQGYVDYDNLTLSEELILFGYKEKVKTDFALDYILLAAKFYIYRSYMANEVPHVQGFLCTMKRRYSDLKSIHFSEGTYYQFSEEWQKYQHLF